jgi:hypothetical protein
MKWPHLTEPQERTYPKSQAEGAIRSMEYAFGLPQPIVWFCARCHLKGKVGPERTPLEVVMLFLDGKIGSHG